MLRSVKDVVSVGICKSRMSVYAAMLFFFPVFLYVVVFYLGLAGGAAGVENEQRVLSIQPLGFTLLRSVSHRLVPPHITLRVPGGLNPPGEQSTNQHMNPHGAPRAQVATHHVY